MPAEVIRPTGGSPAGKLPLSPALRAGPFLFVSGQGSVDDAGNIVADTFEGEFRRTMENIRRILTAAGMTFADVVQVRSYVDNKADVAEYNKLYRDYFSDPFPARTTIVECLGGVIKFEMDVVAYRG